MLIQTQCECDYGYYWRCPIAYCACSTDTVAQFPVYWDRRSVHSPRITQSAERHATCCVRKECSNTDIIRVRAVALDMAVGERPKDLDLGRASKLAHMVLVCRLGVDRFVRTDHDQDVWAI